MADTSAAGDAGADAATGDVDDDAYGGVLGAIPYAFRRSESRLLRSYVVVGGLLSSLVALGFVIGVVVLMSSQNTGGVGGGTFTFSRAFFILVGSLVVAPLLGPILLSARRHRRTGSSAGHDRALAATGYLFALSIYLTLVISAPAGFREEPAGLLAPVVSALYGLPAWAAVVPPLAACGLMVLVHRRL